MATNNYISYSLYRKHIANNITADTALLFFKSASNFYLKKKVIGVLSSHLCCRLKICSKIGIYLLKLYFNLAIVIKK
jgi:hypothetical protein